MLAQACAGKKTSLKAALSDQRVVAGLGNIYVCEALHRAHLSPKRIASTIAIANRRAERRARIALADSHPRGAQRRDPGRRLVAARPSPHRRRARRLPAQFPGLRPRRRECPTPRCKGTIKRIVQGTRSTFFCPVCQK